MEHEYLVNEIFYSLQGEGARMGTANIFIRFAHCNLQCKQEAGPLSPGGFDCDTEFASAEKMSIAQILGFVKELGGDCRNIIFTGGEPLLQLNKDPYILTAFIEAGYKNIIETNGSQSALSIIHLISYIACSPKVAEHAIRLEFCDELRYVRGYGQPIPNPSLLGQAIGIGRRGGVTHKLISPAFDGSDLDIKTLEWCISLVKKNPAWRLSVQQHKLWKVR